MEHVGVISGAVKPTRFNVLLTESTVERGSYVKIRHEVYGWVLARIESMKRYLDDFGEEKTLAEARTIGYKKDESILVPKTPFKPEEKVYMADKKLIVDVLGLKSEKKNSIYLGLLEGHDIPVYLDIKKTIGKHASVLAKTGAGKSYTVAVILEELLKNKMPVVVVDPHGEYGSLAIENDDYDGMMKYDVQASSYRDQITEYAVNTKVNPEAKKLTLKPRFDMIELADIMPVKLWEKQKSTLYNALKQLEGSEYTLKDLMEKVEEEPTRSKWQVISGLEMLEESGIFDGVPVAPEELVREGRASIINLRGAEPHIQELAVAKIAQDLFDARRLGGIPEFFFLIEEAHNFCPERGFGDAISSSILRTIASEGRKFGFHLCVVSQRPARIDKNVLSQCNTQIILKVTNPNDLRAIGQSIESFMQHMESEIKQLSIGHALVVGDFVEQPITVDVRARETKHGTNVVPKEEDAVKEKVEKKKVRKKPEKKKKTFWDNLISIFIEEK